MKPLVRLLAVLLATSVAIGAAGAGVLTALAFAFASFALAGLPFAALAWLAVWCWLFLAAAPAAPMATEVARRTARRRTSGFIEVATVSF
jgi:hypothetical protein